MQERGNGINYNKTFRYNILAAGRESATQPITAKALKYAAGLASLGYPSKDGLVVRMCYVCTPNHPSAILG